jgi:uncharacterized protein YkwD
MSICSLVTALGLAVSGCAAEKPAEQPTFYRTLAKPNAEIDTSTAASMISGFRRNNGLGPVTVDPVLTRMAQEQSRIMAQADKVDHNVTRDFPDRLRTSGFRAGVGAENIAAGYHTLAEAFSGWRDSPSHRANMLNPSVTRIGIATAYSPTSKYKVFWTLILAQPAAPPTAQR